MRQIAGRHAVVTGGSSGIGLAVAKGFARRGATAVSLMARGQPRLDEAAAELAPLGCAVATRAVDVADEHALTEAMQSVVDRFGPCDILVASAGLTYPGHFRDLQIETFRDLMEVNYFGTLYAARAVAPSMVERKAGSIVGVSSAAGLIGVFGYSAYSPTKYAVRGLLETLRVELAPYGVHVGCAFPPDTQTPQLEFEEPLKPAETKAISGSIKPLSAERVAETIVRGVEAERFWIIPDVQTKVLARAGGLARGFLERDFDRRVRKTRRKSAQAKES
jgi:3-dehydrosphinganine reductase